MMRLSNLEKTIVKANARYFLDLSFIGGDVYRRVLSWIDGAEDAETQDTIASWMEHDARWMKSVEPSAMTRLWYVAPAIKFCFSVIRRKFSSLAKQLK